MNGGQTAKIGGRGGGGACRTKMNALKKVISEMSLQIDVLG